MLLGWYDLDKTKHKVPVGWYQMKGKWIVIQQILQIIG